MKDARIIRACPFCGERDHLRMDARFERPLVFEHVTITRPDGGELQEEVDGVSCLVCEAMAPLDVWNGTRNALDFVALRDFDPVELAA